MEVLQHLGDELPWNITVAMSVRTSGSTIPPEQLSVLIRGNRSSAQRRRCGVAGRRMDSQRFVQQPFGD